MKKLLKDLEKSDLGCTFVAGDRFYWSPRDRTVVYDAQAPDNTVACWALLHEVAHAQLDHQYYVLDIDLLLMEVAAWEKAQELGEKHGRVIDQDHIQDCLDTYRDWLDQRSTCPSCGNNGLQENSEIYRCFNCQNTWRVSSSRFSRPYRQVNRIKKTLPPSITEAMFI